MSTASQVPEVSVVVPIHNEAGAIESLVAEIVAALGERDFEIVAVDDGSSDDSPERLARLMADLPRLRLLRHVRQAGQSAALWTGIKAATGEWVATIDGDGQNDPRDIETLLAARPGASDQAPLLIAGHRRQRKDTVVKRLSSRIANAVRACLLRDQTPDTGCGLKLMRRGHFTTLPAFDHFHRFLPALVIRQGGRVLSVDVGHRPRLKGRSHYGTWDRLWVGLYDLFGVSWLQRRPIHVDHREIKSSRGVVP
ncbi:MAG: glycosyltransferase family 2 protein [Alphaproteobacteria bacterium]|nr:glycosyltransferase family 2 protein [Alphaproteobacteria bacterium]